MLPPPRPVPSEQDGESVSDLTPNEHEDSWLDDLDEIVSAWDAVGDDAPLADFDDAEPDTDDDSDVPALLDDAAPDSGAVPQVVLDVDDPDDGLGDDRDDVLDGDGTSLLHGACGVDGLVESLSLVGIEGAADVFAGVDGPMEAPAAVALLDGAGVAARVEYATIGDLAERLAEGIEIVLAGADGSAYALVDIDPDGVVAEPLAGGARLAVPLDRFEHTWDALANEILVVESSSIGLLGTGEVVVVPVAVAEL